MELSTVKELCLKDIPGANACGEDPKYDSVYEGIREEVAKMAGIGHGATDWNKVVVDSAQLLESTAKEFNLVIYLTAGLAQTQGLAGALVGIEALIEFSQKYWDQMFPPIKKLKIRGRAIDWLQERLAETREQGKLDSEDREEVQRAIDLFAQLKDFIYERFEDPPSNFKALKNAYEELLASLPEPQPEPEPEPEPDPEAAEQTDTESDTEKPAAKPAPSKAAAPVQVAAPQLGEDASLEEVLQTLQPMAEQLLVVAPEAPIGYQLLRQTLWADARLPNHQDNMETYIPAPADEMRDSLKTMFGKANWTGLLQRCQDLFMRFPYWLDLQFYAAISCQNLGDSYVPIKRVVQYETYQLVDRLPKIVQLKFDDGSPFASSQTKDWVEKLGAELGGGGGAADDPVAAMKSALMQKGTDAFAEALAESQQAIRGACGLREAMFMRAEVASYCLEAEQFHWAFATLSSLAEQIDELRIASYEPALAARVWSLMVRTCRELREEGANYRDAEQQAMVRLAAVDVGLAGELRVSKSPFAE